MVSSDTLVSVIQAKDMSSYTLHIILVLFSDETFHRVAEDTAILYDRQVDVPHASRLPALADCC